MAEALGFRAGDLVDGWAQTAGGRVAIGQGRLALVKIGPAIARNVAVAFIDDANIQGQALLGMSFLERYRLTVEDAANRIILLAK
jgi:aspartyl protease family protein